MVRLGQRAFNDTYHQPKPMANPKTPYDPRCFLKGCITTSGGDNYHYSGQRRYTAREMALFQSFQYDYQFFGRSSQAMKQIGNAFPPAIAEAMYKTIRMTLEAFDDGLIGPEDDLTDLEGTFAQLRLASSISSPTLQSVFDGSADLPEASQNEEDHDDIVFLGSAKRH